jgi:hypothetical protein
VGPSEDDKATEPIWDESSWDESSWPDEGSNAVAEKEPDDSEFPGRFLGRIKGEPLEPAPPDKTIERMQRGSALWHLLREMDDEGKTLLALAEMNEEDVRDMLVYHLYAWHSGASRGGTSSWWSK